MGFKRIRGDEQYRQLMDERVRFHQQRIESEVARMKYSKGDMDFRRKCDRPVYSSDGKCWIAGMKQAGKELRVCWQAINHAVINGTLCKDMRWGMDAPPEHPKAVIDLDGKKGPWPTVPACAKQFRVSSVTVRRYVLSGRPLKGVRLAAGPDFRERKGGVRGEGSVGVRREAAVPQVGVGRTGGAGPRTSRQPAA